MTYRFVTIEYTVSLSDDDLLDLGIEVDADPAQVIDAVGRLGADKFLSDFGGGKPSIDATVSE